MLEETSDLNMFGKAMIERGGMVCLFAMVCNGPKENISHASWSACTRMVLESDIGGISLVTSVILSTCLSRRTASSLLPAPPVGDTPQTPSQPPI
jgi:hypothetical protein